MSEKKERIKRKEEEQKEKGKRNKHTKTSELGCVERKALSRTYKSTALSSTKVDE